jgi:hypothetical protein
MLIGNKTRARPVPGGRTVERRCDECQAVRTFTECEVADKVSLFFVPVLDLKSRRLVCAECGEDCELPPEAPAAAAASPPRSAPAPKASAGDLEKMLADLKKKMGK